MKKLINGIAATLIASAITAGAWAVVNVKIQETQIESIDKKVSKILCKMGEDSECDVLTKVIK